MPKQEQPLNKGDANRFTALFPNPQFKEIIDLLINRQILKEYYIRASLDNCIHV